MSTEQDNLPMADGEEKKNVNSEENNGINNNLNTADDTTGEAPVDIHMDSPAEEVKEDVSKLPSSELKSTSKEEGLSIDDEKENADSEDKENVEVNSSVNNDLNTADDTTGEAPVDIHMDSPAEERQEDVSNLPSSKQKVSEGTSMNSEKSSTDAKDYDASADNDQSEREEKEEQKVPVKNYDDMSFTDMISEAADLLKNYAPILLKDAFTGLRDTFRKKADELESLAKEKFLAEGGNEIDFRHDNPHATKFFDIYTEYRSKVEAHYKEAEAKQEANLKEREAIIEELKALYTEPAENNSQIFKRFRDLKTRWHNAGRIPKAQASNIFKTYYFHLDNFNEFLDMNQELRKMDYEHNLEVRHSIIERAKALLNEENVQKALNELQYLHRMWKEEAVPVAEEFRETTWQEFKDLTSKIHDRKNELNEKIKQKQEENLAKKKEIISKISSLIENEVPKSHNAWQRKIKEMKSLRDEFFAVGRVPKEDNQPTWDAFKEASKHFNHEKNDFYKKMKSEQMDNLEKKRELVKIALEHRDSTDWNESVKVVKKIQSDWKKIGHVPRKFSDKIWKEFSDANNTFFDRYKNRNNEKLEKQQKNLEAKEALLKEMKEADKPKDKDALLAWLNDYSIKWSSIGYVPNGKQEINKELTKLTEKTLKDAGLNADAIDKAQWNSQIDRIKSTLDESMLRNLRYDVRKQMDEVQKEVTHLQTNLAFFSNADDTNPLFKNAIQNIENKVSELKGLESKLEDLKHINLEALAESQAAEKAEKESAEQAEKEAAAAQESSEVEGSNDDSSSSDKTDDA